MTPLLIEVVFHKQPGEYSPKEQEWVVMALHTLANEIEKGGHRQTLRIKIASKNDPKSVSAIA